MGPLPKKSVGFITGDLTPEGARHPVFQGLPWRLMMFKWHGQGALPPLPAGVEILACSGAAPVEALGLKGNPKVVGLQFDNHAGPEDVRQWLEVDAPWALSGTGVNPEACVLQARAQEAVMAREFLLLVHNFLKVGGLV